MAVNILQSLSQGTVGNMNGSDIALQINNLIKGNGSLGKANPVDFYADSDGLGGGTDDSANILTAINQLNHGETLTLPEGKILRASASIFGDLSSKSITIDGNGASICFDIWNHEMTLHGGWDSIQAFTTITEDDGTEIISGIPDTSLIRARDWVRIISDDLPKDTWKTSARQSNDLYVEEIIDSTSIRVAGNTFQTLGVDNTYATNPRICQRSGNTAFVKNLTFFTLEGQVPEYSQNRAHLNLTCLTNPIAFNVVDTRAYGASIKLKSNINAVVWGGSCGDHDDFQYGDDTEAYGYGVSDASYGTIIQSRTGKRVRHFIDTDDQAYGSNQVPEYYGGSVNMQVHGCKGYATTNGTFSTHHANKNTTFHNCDAYNSLNSGFGLRGDVTLYNCNDFNCVISINTFDEQDTVPSRTTSVIYNHVSKYSGPLVNANSITAQNFYNYRAENARYDNTSWIKDRDDSVTKFHGHTRVSFLDCEAYQPIIGTLNTGTIIFDTMEWEFTNELISELSRIMICDEGGTYDWKMYGKHLHIIGDRPEVFMRGSGTDYPVNNLRFKVTFDSDINYTSVNVTDTIKLTHQGNWLQLGGILECEYGEFLRGASNKVIRDTIDFGASVADGVSVTADVTVNGTMLVDSVVINSTVSADVTVNYSRVSADGVVTVRVTNNSGTTLDLSSASLYMTIEKV